MKAVVYHKPKDMRVDNVDDPKIEEPRDAILRVTTTAICGSDLHMYNGWIPQVRPMTMGHEFMGIIEDVGSEVTNLKKGDRVVVPFPIACGQMFDKGIQMWGGQSLPLNYIDELCVKIEPQERILPSPQLYRRATTANRIGQNRRRRHHHPHPTPRPGPARLRHLQQKRGQLHQSRAQAVEPLGKTAKAPRRAKTRQGFIVKRGDYEDAISPLYFAPNQPQ